MNYLLTPWDDAARSLKSILPSAYSFALNIIDSAAGRDGYNVETTTIPKWEDATDTEILHRLKGQDSLSGPEMATLLPSLCFYHKNLPFAVGFKDVEAFVAGFRTRFREAFFNGDTVILFPSCKRIYALHHEGLCIRIQERERG